jgi:hypothetical protein
MPARTAACTSSRASPAPPPNTPPSADAPYDSADTTRGAPVASAPSRT